MDRRLAAIGDFQCTNNIFYTLDIVPIRHEHGVRSFDNHKIVYARCRN